MRAELALYNAGDGDKAEESEGKPVPAEFSKPEVIAILKEYYDSLEEKVEVKLHGAATGDLKKQNLL